MRERERETGSMGRVREREGSCHGRRCLLSSLPPSLLLLPCPLRWRQIARPGYPSPLSPADEYVTNHPLLLLSFFLFFPSLSLHFPLHYRRTPRPFDRHPVHNGRKSLSPFQFKIEKKLEMQSAPDRRRAARRKDQVVWCESMGGITG